SLYQAFAAAMSQIGAAQLNKPNLIWFHSRGMYGPWDAPLALQETLLDEGDPPPIGSATPPDLELSSDHDPDVIFRYACAYAAQVMVLDSCCERLQDGLQTAEDEPWLAMLIGCRGYPLGEHFRIGRVDPRLYAEQLHVPWLIRIPDGLGCLARSQALTSHHDLLPMLIDWIDRDATTDRAAFDGQSILPLATAARTPWREALISTSPTARAIRTAEWCLREDLALSSKANRSEEGEKFPQPELYVRPDDRWEANDVAKLCPDVVHELRARLIKTAHSARC
ncbi:MAG TPA: sulfatase-like hydrolase/transferase, partial [Lacipirellulaceae bacterium]|nr:sulfatase-like hydrolase/transferase [Lacipirellulaceae bacterium]